MKNYLYTASGEKRQKIVTNGTVIATTDYLGGFQYLKPTSAGAVALQYFPHAEGYVSNTVISGNNTYNYVFNYTDHLGNIRLTYTWNTATSSLKILEENHYYPFGLKHTKYNIDQAYYEACLELNDCIIKVSRSPFQYKYNGQENQDELGLNVTAMDFRQYDNALGRFNGIDLLAENSMEMTPYHFGNNNPNYWADPSGLDPTDPPGDWQPEAVVINRTTKKKHKVLSSASVIDGFLSGVFSGSNYGANPFEPGSFESIMGGGGGGIAAAGVTSVFQPITASMPVFRPAATTTQVAQTDSVDVSDVISDLWNSVLARTIVPDRIIFNASYTAIPFIGTASDFSLNWITRGHDASLIPYVINTVGISAGTPNLSASIGIGIGYYPIADMRSLNAGDASNGMLGWSYTGSAIGAADGGRVSINGSIGVRNLSNPLSIIWLTTSGSIGVGTPGIGGIGGVGYSIPAFNSQF